MSEENVEHMCLGQIDVIESENQLSILYNPDKWEKEESSEEAIHHILLRKREIKK